MHNNPTVGNDNVNVFRLKDLRPKLTGKIIRTNFIRLIRKMEIRLPKFVRGVILPNIRTPFGEEIGLDAGDCRDVGVIGADCHGAVRVGDGLGVEGGCLGWPGGGVWVPGMAWEGEWVPGMA